MVKFHVTISAIFIVFESFAQLSVFESPGIDDIDPEVRLLTEKIETGASDERGKVAEIYSWIISNINYDGSVAKRPAVYRSSSEIIASRHAICFGYARLFRDMCAASGIESFVVTGYAFSRGIPYHLPKEANHAWNSVKIDGQWQLVDPTWGSGDESADFFLSPPAEFAKTHVPSYYGWRLTSCTGVNFFNSEICGLRDSLAGFISSSVVQRAIVEAKADYLMNPSERNKHLLGQVYISHAVDLKERADASHDSLSLVMYDRAIVAFKLGAKHVEQLFDWQTEAWAFAMLNKASVRYNTLSKESYSTDILNLIIDLYHDAIAKLETVHNSFTASTALIQANKQLVDFKAELSRIKN